jgi:hypothetical protein
MKMGSLLFYRQTHNLRPRAAASVMDSLRTWDKNHLPIRVPASPAPIHVLAVHEEALVQQSDILDSLSSQHPEAPDQDIHRHDPVM